VAVGSGQIFPVRSCVSDLQFLVVDVAGSRIAEGQSGYQGEQELEQHGNLGAVGRRGESVPVWKIGLESI